MHVSLFGMWKAVLLLFLLLTPTVLAKGKTLRVNGRGFSFSISEPEGWLVDFRSAAQIANFVIHPRLSTWREASVVVFGRFVAKQPKETLETFVDNALEEFQNSCPFFDIQGSDLELDGPHLFTTKILRCPGVRHEMVAITEVSGFFISFVLSADSPNGLREAQSPFQEVLSSFLWLTHNSSRRPTTPENP